MACMVLLCAVLWSAQCALLCTVRLAAAAVPMPCNAHGTAFNPRALRLTAQYLMGILPQCSGRRTRGMH